MALPLILNHQGVKIQFLTPPPEKQLCLRVHCVENTPIYDVGLGTIRKLPLVLEYQVRQEDLDFVGGEEAAGTSMGAVAEPEMLRACTDEVGLLSSCGILAHAEEAISIKLVTVLVESVVPHVRRTDSTQGPLGHHHAIG